MKKTSLTVLSVLLTALVLAGCMGTKTTETTVDTGAAVETPVVEATVDASGAVVVETPMTETATGAAVEATDTTATEVVNEVTATTAQ